MGRRRDVGTEDGKTERRLVSPSCRPSVPTSLRPPVTPSVPNSPAADPARDGRLPAQSEQAESAVDFPTAARRKTDRQTTDHHNSRHHGLRADQSEDRRQAVARAFSERQGGAGAADHVDDPLRKSRRPARVEGHRIGPAHQIHTRSRRIRGVVQGARKPRRLPPRRH